MALFLATTGARRRVRRRARFRHPRYQRRLAVAVAAVVAAAFLGSITYALFAGWSHNRARGDERQRPRADAFLAGTAVSPRQIESRPVYRHSVIPGGVYSAIDVARAVERDPVVAAHYASIDVARLRRARVPRSRRVYVSYRKDDKIYWTKRPVLLAQDEVILTDGHAIVRARCGNCISDEPMEPTAADEPAANELDTVEIVPATPGPGPQTSAPSSLPSWYPIFVAAPVSARVASTTPLITQVPSNPQVFPVVFVPPPGGKRDTRHKVQQIPEPGLLLLLGGGTASLLLRRCMWRRGRRVAGEKTHIAKRCG
jgi:hypothetical protein